MPERLAGLPYRPQWLERLHGERRVYRTELSHETCAERMQTMLTKRLIWPFGDDERMRGEVDRFSFYCFPVDGAWGMIAGIPSVALYGRLVPADDGGTRIEVRQTVPMFWLWQLLSPIAALIVTAALFLSGSYSFAKDPERTVFVVTFLPGTLIITVFFVKRLLAQMRYPMFHVIEHLLEAEEVEGASFDHPFVWMDLRA